MLVSVSCWFYGHLVIVLLIIYIGRYAFVSTHIFSLYRFNKHFYFILIDLVIFLWILTLHAVHNGSVSEDNTMKEEARKLFHDGLENKLILFFNNILSSSYPEQMVCSVSIYYFLILHDYIRWVVNLCLVCDPHITLMQLL